MRAPERRLAIKPPVQPQPEPATCVSLSIPDLEQLLVETLAAASTTTARCEGMLALLAAQRHRDPRGPCSALWDAFDTGTASRVTRTDHAGSGCDSAARHVTPREMQVLCLIAAGTSNKEIAAALSVSVRTIERHITNVYRKIGARGKADATAWVVHQRLG